VDSDLLDKLAQKTITKQQLCQAVAENFELLPQLVKGVSSPKASIRYGCSSVLVDLSAQYPKKLYPCLDVFIGLLDSKYRILTWNATVAIANLCCVDVNQKFDAVFCKYFNLINSGYLITAANVVANAGKIALAKPHFIPQITNGLLKIDALPTTPHLTDECKRVLAEHAIASFDMFFGGLDAAQKQMVLGFVAGHQDSSRKTLGCKASVFLQRWGA
jgi:hypothetical protein